MASRQRGRIARWLGRPGNEQSRDAQALCLALATPGPALAQALLGEYFTFIDYADMVNSRGTRLTTFCAMVQQDRANMHTFNRAHELEDWDPWFKTAEARSRISSDCRIGEGAEYIPPYALGGEEIYIRVRVFGHGNAPQFVVVEEGAG